MNILIAGAAGNLGVLVTRHLLNTPHELRLLIHKTPLPVDIASHTSGTAIRADLAQPETLKEACKGIDCIVHLAGLLFAPLPERFLPITNVGYVKNLAQVASQAGARKFILVSFPHTEGETTPEHPAIGRLDAAPGVIHFRTRLEAERHLLEKYSGAPMAPIIFRSGIVYGDGIKLIEQARWMVRHRLLAVWRKPTWVHLIALPDFLDALRAAIEKDEASGIYQVCDDGPLTMQELLDRLADHYKCPHPWRLPTWMFHFAGFACEASALLLRTPAALNRDIVRAGMTSCVADTSRLKRDLLPILRYSTIKHGIRLL